MNLLEITSEAPYLNKEWWDEDIPLYGYKRISELEYQKAKTEMLNEMSKQTKLRKFLVKKWRV